MDESRVNIWGRGGGRVLHTLLLGPFICTQTDWWPSGPHCAACSGWPEEMRILRAAMRRGYAVLALSSRDRAGHRCWEGDEAKAIAGVVREWVEREGLKALPVAALGASSGGYFVSSLPAELREMRAVGIYIAAGDEGALEADGYPPAVFAHMPRDTNTAAGVARALRRLGERGVATKEIKQNKRPVTASLLADRVPGFGLGAAKAFVATLQSEGHVDAHGFLLSNPRSSKWQELLPPDVKRLADGIGEELNVAYAHHELSGFDIAATLDFFEKYF